MKIVSETVLSVISANERPSADGKTMYYNLAVMQNGEVANVSCDKTVHDTVLCNLRPNIIMHFRFGLAVDLTYKNVKIVRVSIENNDGVGQPDNGTKADNKAAAK